VVIQRTVPSKHSHELSTLFRSALGANKHAQHFFAFDTELTLKNNTKLTPADLADPRISDFAMHLNNVCCVIRCMFVTPQTLNPLFQQAFSLQKQQLRGG